MFCVLIQFCFLGNFDLFIELFLSTFKLFVSKFLRFYIASISPCLSRLYLLQLIQVTALYHSLVNSSTNRQKIAFKKNLTKTCGQGKCPVGEMSGRGNVQSRKFPVRELSIWGNVCSGKCPSAKCPLGK